MSNKQFRASASDVYADQVRTATGCCTAGPSQEQQYTRRRPIRRCERAGAAASARAAPRASDGPSGGRGGGAAPNRRHRLDFVKSPGV